MRKNKEAILLLILFYIIQPSIIFLQLVIFAIICFILCAFAWYGISEKCAFLFQNLKYNF